MRNLLVGFSVLTTALLLGTGCSDEGVTVIGAPEVETGRAAFALTNGIYTLEASIEIRDGDDVLANTVVLDASTALENSVFSADLPVGSYTMDILNDEFTLSDINGEVAATFVDFDPDPLVILDGETTAVAINFTVGEDVITVEPPPDPEGDAEFTLVVGETCGASAACELPLVCAQVGEEGDPFCATTCDPLDVGTSCDGGGLTGTCLAEAAPGTGGICEVDLP